MTEEFLGSLTSKQRRTLLGRLIDNDYVYERVTNSYGHVRVKNALPEHPRERDGAGEPLAVGFVSVESFYLVNTDCRFPEDYHGNLKDLYCQSVNIQPVKPKQAA